MQSHDNCAISLSFHISKNPRGKNALIISNRAFRNYVETHKTIGQNIEPRPQRGFGKLLQPQVPRGEITTISYVCGEASEVIT